MRSMIERDTFSGMPATIAVSNSPGAMLTTRIPYGARSRATGRVNPITPALLALYAACPICPCQAAPDDVFTITPRSPSSPGVLSTIRAAASRITLNVPVRFTAITLSQVASGNGTPFETVLAASATPAQLTTMWMDPNRSTPAAIAAATLLSSATLAA